MKKTTLHNTKRILAMMLSLALLVSTFCCTGITLPVSAAESDGEGISNETKMPMVVVSVQNATKSSETGNWEMQAGGSIKITNLTVQDSTQGVILNPQRASYVLELTAAVGTINSVTLKKDGANTTYPFTDAQDGWTLSGGPDSLAGYYIEITSNAGATISGMKLYNSDTSDRNLYFTAVPKTVSLELQILDYVPNGLLFQMDTVNYSNSEIPVHTPNNVFTLDPNGIRHWYYNVKGYSDDPDTNKTPIYAYGGKGFSSEHAEKYISLVENQLVDNHPVYKALVVEYLVDQVLRSEQFYNATMTNLREEAQNMKVPELVNPGTASIVDKVDPTTIKLSDEVNNGGTEWNKLITLITGINREYRVAEDDNARAEALGSWENTLSKVEPIEGVKKNGCKLAYNQIKTLYDAAYYMLNTLFVSDSNYNTQVTEYETLTMQAGAKDSSSDYKEGYYVFDSDKELSYDNNTIAAMANSSGKANAFFPIDNLGYADRVTASSDGVPGDHNYAYTMWGHGEFTYHETADGDAQQYFFFSGDDDVYLFINGYCVFSLDGLHSRSEGDFRLTPELAAEIGLESGKTCSFDFYYMERHTTESNLKIYTNIAVQKPSLTVEKNAYADEEYTQSFHATDDTVSPFTTVYYEFVLQNVVDKNSGAAPFVNIEFNDPRLGTYIGYDKFTFNTFTGLSDLVFIVINEATREQTKYYSANGQYFTATKPQDATEWSVTKLENIASAVEYEKYIRNYVLFAVTEQDSGEGYVDLYNKPITTPSTYGLAVGYTLKVQGVKAVLTETLPNTVYTYVRYYDGVGYPDPVYGSANQTTNVSSWDKVYTVDYSNPLVVNPFDGVVTFESTSTNNEITATNITGMKESELGSFKLVEVQEGDGTLTANDGGSYTYTYTLNGEMTQTQVYQVTETIEHGEADKTPITLNVATEGNLTDGVTYNGTSFTRLDDSGNPQNVPMSFDGNCIGNLDLASVADKNYAWVQFAVTVPSDCTAELKLHYVNGRDDASRVYLAYGQSESTLTRPAVGESLAATDASITDDRWNVSCRKDSTFTETLNLKMGVNYIRLYGGDGGFNVYGITVTPQKFVSIYTKTITFVPASNVYYDDAFMADKKMLTHDNTWTKEGTAVENNIDERKEDVYGHGGNQNFANNTQFFNGSALKATGAVDSYPKLTFRFTGMGVDVFTLTNSNTGVIRAKLSKVEEGGGMTLKRLQFIDCEYASGALYQIPVISLYEDSAGKALDWGTYEVEIVVYDQAVANGRADFYFDGIRVYNPLERKNPTDLNAAKKYDDEDEWNATYISLRDMLLSTDAIDKITVESNKGNGALYYDYITKDNDQGEGDKGKVEFKYNAEEYKKYGPKHEVYLAAGQAISFTLAEGYKGAQIAVKAADGQETKMVVYYTVNGVLTEKEIAINSTAEMFYTLPESENDVYIIKNGGEAVNNNNPILSLSKLKLTYAAVITSSETEGDSADAPNGALVVTADTVAYATAVLNGDTETAAALAEKLSANKVEEYGIGSVTPVLNGATAPTVTVEAVDATELAIEEALEARDALVKTLVARICTAA